MNLDSKDVSPDEGTIPLDKTELEQVPALVYDYPLPLGLQTDPLFHEPVPGLRFLERLERLPIFVVHSTQFATFPSNDDPIGWGPRMKRELHQRPGFATPSFLDMETTSQ
jgi:hypothetical protein